MKEQEFEPRSYQTELFDHVLNKNSIICMGTGTGKTFIAIMLIKQKSYAVRAPFDEGGKRTFFLTNSTALAGQQAEVLKQHTDLNVGVYIGADGVDQWMVEPERWLVEFRKNQVLVLTAQILLDILQHGILNFSQINVLVFDECHNAKQNHPYGRIMDIGRDTCPVDQFPHILGLTASIIDRNVAADMLEQSIAELEQRLCSTAVTSVDFAAMAKFGTKPEEILVEFDHYQDETGLTAKLDAIMGEALVFLELVESGYKVKKAKVLSDATETVNIQNEYNADGQYDILVKLITEMKDTIAVLHELGPCAAEAVAYDTVIKLEREAKYPPEPKAVNRRLIRLALSVFRKFRAEYDEYDCDHVRNYEDILQLVSPQVLKLVDEVLLTYCQEEYEDDCSDMMAGEWDDDDDDDDDDNMNHANVMEDDEEGNTDEEKEDDEESCASDNEADEMFADVKVLAAEEPDEAKEIAELKRKAATTSDEMLGIIFVKRRKTAFALHKLIEVNICAWEPRLSFISSSFITGLGGGRKDKISETEAKKNARQVEETLRKFRKKEYNLLVATDVLQEGIDVPRCNMVTMFETPKTYRAYVQTKGRARAESARFFVMASSREIDAASERIVNYQAYEDIIAKKCLQRKQLPERSESELVEEHLDDYLPPYKVAKPDGSGFAMVTMTSAVRLVNMYCAKLPADSYTKLTPDCTFDQVETDTGLTLFRCTITLPINSPVRDPVKGDPMPRKKLSQMAAALKTIEILHKHNELNDYLLPVPGGASEEDDRYKPGKPGAKRTQFYTKRIADCLSDCAVTPAEPCFLYSIETKLNEEMLNTARITYAVEESTRRFGILSRKRIPLLPEFSVYSRTGEEVVSLKLVSNSICLNAEQLQRINQFQQYLTKSILKLEKDLMIFEPDKVGSVHILPLNSQEPGTMVIDWKFIDYVESKRKKKSDFYVPYSDKTFEFVDNTWNDAIVCRTYNYLDRPQYFYVSVIRRELRPLSDFPSDNYSNFEDYYSSKYFARISNLDQPLLEVHRTALRLNMIKPRHREIVIPSQDEEEKEGSEREKHETLFVPELCGIHIFPGTSWRQAVMLPSILHRVNYLCIAEELRSRIATEVGIGKKVADVELRHRLDFGWKMEEAQRHRAQILNSSDGANVAVEADKDESQKAVLPSATSSNTTKKLQMHILLPLRRKELAKIEKVPLFRLYEPAAEYGPDTCLILQALTMASANDLFSLERMETMGDSFLKYAVTVYLYHQYPRLDEGKLTQKRIGQISNLNLYRIGKTKGFAESLVCSRFEPVENWLAPGYTLRERVVPDEDAGVDHIQETHSMMKEHALFDKNISDAVEALIGTYLITCGTTPALKFMTWLGLKVQPDTENLKKLLPPVFKKIYEDDLIKQTCGFEKLEDSINYKFKDRGYLLQALTHASYPYNRITDCYQRLEFLGDAILDYVITRFLFEDSRRLSPGVLTDLRSALVNNNTFAKLAVKFNMYQSFNYLSSDLYSQINFFVKNCQDEELGLGDEDVEAPKALGDIFESVAGAVFLDCGESLETIWSIYYPMMKPLIEKYTITIPKSPVRELLEKEPDAVSFEKPYLSPDGKIKVTVCVVGKGSYTGTGRNARLARTSAARKALKAILQMEAQGMRMGTV